ncbi:MAG: glycosyltransferase family 2 protein [Prevotella sp.]|nr:glycosyltransferase family 2 protein [Prevotella sp.]
MNIREYKPLVSFIITYYNLPVQMLQECIDSILALSLRPFEREIIVIDDGSDQSPINDLMKYGDDIIYVRQKNGGVSVARNKGMQIAKGQYIQFMDGDDYLIQAPYEECLDIIRYNEDADIVMFDFAKDYFKTKHAISQHIKTSGVNLMRNNNLHGSVCCLLFRQSTRGALNFTPNICYGEDEEFTPQLLLRAETVYHTTARAYFYRQHNTSAIHQHDEENKQKRLEDSLNVILHLHQLSDKLPVNERLALQRRIAQLTMDYIYNTIMLLHSQKALDNALSVLRDKGLFPLPDKGYTKKYTWFRRMANSNIGRAILLHSLPLLKKER